MMGRLNNDQGQLFYSFRSWGFTGIVNVDPKARGKLEIAVRVTATNLHGEIAESASVDLEPTTMRIEELVNVKSWDYLLEYPLQKRFGRVLWGDEVFDSDREDD
jgi:hypothetical protein